jgi:galactarate dehydratase
MVVSLGCEKLQPERCCRRAASRSRDERASRSPKAALDVVCLQDDAHVGFMSMIDSILRQAERAPGAPERAPRETVPASELVVGVQCGGSDAFSGRHRQPGGGLRTDLLVRAGATVMFSENTEVRDGVDQLTARAATPEVAEPSCARWPGTTPTWSAAASTAAPTPRPGNKAGGLSNIVEKAMGSIVKSGSAPISGVLAPGEKLRPTSGPGVRRHAGQRLHLRHAAAGRRHEPARVHHRPRHALRPGRVPGDQGGHAQRPGAPLARPDGRERRHASPTASQTIESGAGSCST